MYESAPGATAVRLLLRRLDDPRALRTNPLVRHLFADEGTATAAQTQTALRQVRDAVAALIEEMAFDPVLGKRAQRYQTILLRCDLGGELHKCVASELGIGIRQFYRERQAARNYAAEHLHAKLQRYSRPAAQAIDTAALVRMGATALRNSGEPDRAIALLRDMARSCTDPRERIAAMTAIANLLADQGHLGRARGVINDARRRLSWSADAIPDALDECTARIAASEARLLWESGRQSQAAELEARNAALFESLRQTHSPQVREFTVVTQLERTWRLVSTGDFPGAQSTVEHARRSLSTLSEQPAYLRAGLLIAIGTLENIRDGDDAAIRHFDDALLIAQHNHLVEDTLRALSGLSVAQQLRGDTALAHETLSAAIDTAKHACTRVTYGLFCLRLAELKSALGDPAGSMRLAADAREYLGESSFARLIALLIEAEAALGAKSYAVAVESARAAERYAARHENRRMQGTALRVLAEGLNAAGDRAAACEFIVASVDLLESAGHPFALSRAYASSAAITGSRSHARNAREIASRLAKR